MRAPDVILGRPRGAAQQALAAPGVLERVYPHPGADIVEAQLLSAPTWDSALHAWDLARAIGADERLDAQLAADGSRLPDAGGAVASKPRGFRTTDRTD